MTTPIQIDSQQFIREVILREIKTIVYSAECASAPYVKFILIATGIEFLGACGDAFSFEKNLQSEERFNHALNTYFNKKYQKFAKKDSSINLYEDFRCAMIHQLRPTTKIDLTERGKGNSHLQESASPLKLYLVLEDFYDDLEKAALKFLKMAGEGKISDVQKTKSNFLQINPSSSGLTETVI
jgi:hypothetical protein